MLARAGYEVHCNSGEELRAALGPGIAGQDSFAYEWKDAVWFFSSAENRDKFIADPERWAPQYGGYCA